MTEFLTLGGGFLLAVIWMDLMFDVQALRAFQSSHRSPAKPFKPVPDGFEIDFSRKVLPAGEGHCGPPWLS